MHRRSGRANRELLRVAEFTLPQDGFQLSLASTDREMISLFMQGCQVYPHHAAAIEGEAARMRDLVRRIAKEVADRKVA